MPTQKDITIKFGVDAEDAERKIGRLNARMSSFSDNIARLSAKFIVIQYSFKLLTEYLSKIANTEYFKQIENGILGIASSYSTLYNFIDKTGKIIPVQDAWAKSIQMATDDVNKLKIANMQTTATLDQLVKAYQTALPIATQVGFTPEQARQFTVRAVQAASAFDPELLYQMPEEIRSLLTGNISERTSRLALVLGLRKEDIEKHKSNANDLFNFLMDKMSALEIAGQASQNTLSGIISNLKDALNFLREETIGDLLNVFKTELKIIYNNIVNIDKATGQIKLNPDLVASINQIKSVFISIYVTLRQISAVIKDIIYLISGLAQIIQATILNVINNIWQAFRYFFDVITGKKKLSIEGIANILSTTGTQWVNEINNAINTIYKSATFSEARKAYREIGLMGLMAEGGYQYLEINDTNKKKIEEIKKAKIRINGKEVDKYIYEQIDELNAFIYKATDITPAIKKIQPKPKGISEEETKRIEKIKDYWEKLENWKKQKLYEDADIITKNIMSLEGSFMSSFGDAYKLGDKKLTQALNEALVEGKKKEINKIFQKINEDVRHSIEKAESENKTLSISSKIKEEVDAWLTSTNVTEIQKVIKTVLGKPLTAEDFNLENLKTVKQAIDKHFGLTEKEGISLETLTSMFIEKPKVIRKNILDKALESFKELEEKLEQEKIERKLEEFAYDFDVLYQKVTVSNKEIYKQLKMLEGTEIYSEAKKYVDDYIRFQIDKIKELEDAGTFKSFFSGMSEGIKKVIEELYNLKNMGVSLMKSMASSMTNTLSTVFFDAFQGRMQSLKSYLIGFFNSINQALSQVMAQMIVSGIFKSLNASFSIGGNPAGTTVTETGQAVWYGGNVGMWTTKHTGGYVLKMHFGGLAPDEVPAILQTGEYVVSRKGVRALDKINNGDIEGLQPQQPIVINTNMNIQALDAKSFYEYAKKNKNIFTGIFFQELKNNYQFNKAVREAL